MTTATKPKTAKPKTPESVEWCAADVGGALQGMLGLADGKRRAVYAVSELKGDAPRTFILSKYSGGSDDEATGYVVACTHGGIPVSCECRGWLRWGTACRHLQAVGQLVSQGKL